MRHAYPAVFHPEEEGGFSIYFPDIHRGATQGDTIEEGIAMAEDFLALALYRMEEAGEGLPIASNPNDLEMEKGDIVTLVAADTNFYRLYYENKSVKKTLSIPAWLNMRAEEAHLNFSQALQKALKAELKIMN